MLVLPLNLRILKLLGGLVCLSSVLILIAQWYATSDYANKQVMRDLQVGQSVIQEVFENRERLLFNSADVLTRDFGFRTALASGDRLTLRSALENLGGRISSDLTAAVSLDGELLAVTGLDIESGNERLFDKAFIDRVLENGGAIKLLLIEDKLYQTITLLVEAPNPIAIAVVAFEVDTAILEQIKNIIQLDIIMMAETDKSAITISSLPDLELEKVMQAPLEAHAHGVSIFSDADTYASRRFTFSDAGVSPKVSILLTDKLSKWHQDFKYLLNETIGIGVLSVIVSLILGLLFSNNLTRPLALLAKRANKISKGVYSEEAPVRAKSEEIKNLADAFETMQHDIQVREKTIQYQAQHDALTDLFNRTEAANLIERKLAAGETFQAISFKAMSFREVNTAFGLPSGDACIRSLAERISALGGTAARLGGSEILWLSDSPKSEEELASLRKKLEAPHQLGDIAITIKLAVGSVMLPEHTDNTELLFRYLSVAIDDAQLETNRIKAYSEGMEEVRIKRLSILRELEIALNKQDQDLDLFYQPKLNLFTGKIEKAEALIRWNSEKLGFVPPDEFIPIAEKAGLIESVTRWVIRRAVRDVLTWKEQGVALKLAINLSVHDVSNVDFMKEIYDTLLAAGLSTDALEFEITESDIMTDPDEAIALLTQFRNYGFDLAIDDFGTGYSSLAYLKNMPVSELKIDKSFVLNLSDDQNDQLIVKSIIGLAQQFGLKLVAEGVEDQSALQLLQNWGCHWAQGYFISRPVNLPTLLEWLKENEQTKWL